MANSTKPMRSIARVMWPNEGDLTIILPSWIHVPTTRMIKKWWKTCFCSAVFSTGMFQYVLILQVWQAINISGSRPHEYGCFTGADAPWPHGTWLHFCLHVGDCPSDLEPGSWKHQENLTGDDAADWKRLPFPWLVCNPSAAWPGSVANGNKVFWGSTNHA